MGAGAEQGAAYGESHADREPQIADHQEDRYRGANGKGNVKRDVVREVGQPQMQGEEGRRQEGVVHGVEVDIPQRRNDEDQEEEEQQGHRRKNS